MSQKIGFSPGTKIGNYIIRSDAMLADGCLVYEAENFSSASGSRTVLIRQSFQTSERDGSTDQMISAYASLQGRSSLLVEQTFFEAGNHYVVFARPKLSKAPDAIARLSAEQLISCLVPLLSDLEAMHASGLTHGALSEETICLAEDQSLVVLGLEQASMKGDPLDDVRMLSSFCERMFAPDALLDERGNSLVGTYHQHAGLAEAISGGLGRYGVDSITSMTAFREKITAKQRPAAAGVPFIPRRLTSLVALGILCVVGAVAFWTSADQSIDGSTGLTSVDTDQVLDIDADKADIPESADKKQPPTELSELDDHAADTEPNDDEHILALPDAKDLTINAPDLSESRQSNLAADPNLPVREALPEAPSRNIISFEEETTSLVKVAPPAKPALQTRQPVLENVLPSFQQTPPTKTVSSEVSNSVPQNEAPLNEVAPDVGPQTSLLKSPAQLEAARASEYEQTLSSDLTPNDRDLMQFLSDELPPHKTADTFKDCDICPSLVAIPENEAVSGFAIGLTEVTLGEFTAFLVATNRWSRDEADKSYLGQLRYRSPFGPGFEQTSAHPATFVSYTDAQAYVDWLSARTGERYRLPTEQEWTYAAIAETNSRYLWGDARHKQCTYANAADKSLRALQPGKLTPSCNDRYATTAPVASFEPNRNGLYDMVGNVAEWVSNCKDPVRSGTNCTRGGAWSTLPGELEVNYDEAYERAETRANTIGLRVVREL